MSVFNELKVPLDEAVEIHQVNKKAARFTRYEVTDVKEISID